MTDGAPADPIDSAISRVVEAVESRRLTVFVEHADERLRPAVLRQRLQRGEIVGEVHGGHDDALFASPGQLRVHHDPRDPRVAVGEGVDLGDQEHHEYPTLKWCLQAAANPETLGQRAGHEVRRHEHGEPGLVGCPLERSGPSVGTALHDRCVTGCQQRFQCPGIGGSPTHLPNIGDDAPGAQDVVCIRGPFIGYGAAEHDVGGLVDGELGTLDEVREVGIEEGQRRMALRPAVGCNPGERWMVAKRRVQDLEQSHTVRIIGSALMTGDG